MFRASQPRHRPQIHLISTAGASHTIPSSPGFSASSPRRSTVAPPATHACSPPRDRTNAPATSFRHGNLEASPHARSSYPLPALPDQSPALRSAKGCAPQLCQPHRSPERRRWLELHARRVLARVEEARLGLASRVDGGTSLAQLPAAHLRWRPARLPAPLVHVVVARLAGAVPNAPWLLPRRRHLLLLAARGGVPDDCRRRWRPWRKCGRHRWKWWR